MSGGGRLGGKKVMRLGYRMSAAGDARVVASGRSRTHADRPQQARGSGGTDSPVGITVPGGGTVDVRRGDARGWRRW